MEPELGTGRGYHHGDLRAALLAVAGRLLEEVGAERLSLRGVAEQAGVSHQAPYNHFRDKQALLAALARGGFDDLTEATAAAAAEAATPVAQLEQAALAYIGQATARPFLFRLMFAHGIADPVRHPETAAGARRSYDALRRIVQAGVHADAVEETTRLAWAMVHGYATLANGIGWKDDGEPARKSFARRCAQLLVTRNDGEDAPP